MVRSGRCILGMEIIRQAKFSSLDPRETSVIAQQFAFMDTDSLFFSQLEQGRACFGTLTS